MHLSALVRYWLENLPGFIGLEAQTLTGLTVFVAGIIVLPILPIYRFLLYLLPTIWELYLDLVTLQLSKLSLISAAWAYLTNP